MSLSVGFLLGLVGAFYLGAIAFALPPFLLNLKGSRELPEGASVGWLLLGLIGGVFGIALFLWAY